MRDSVWIERITKQIASGRCKEPNHERILRYGAGRVRPCHDQYEARMCFCLTEHLNSTTGQKQAGYPTWG
jgi:hypothetical protein